MKFKFSRLRRAAVCAFACCIAPAFADTAATTQYRRISWDVPLANEDGSPLDDLMGYYVYMGDSPGTMVPYYFTPSLQQPMVYEYVPAGVHCLAVTAVNVEGVESELSQILIL